MRLAFSTLMFTAVALLLGCTGVNAAPQHALTVYGEAPKYPASFSHFAYTNPQAPKGGTMRRSAVEMLPEIVLALHDHTLGLDEGNDKDG